MNLILREKMLDVLDCTHIDELFAMSGELFNSFSFAAMMKANVYIWAEKDLHAFVRVFKSLDLNVHRVVCAEPKEFQKVDDVEIIPPQDLLTDETPRKFFFVVLMDYSEDGNFWQEQMKILSPVGFCPLGYEEKAILIGNHPIFDTDKLYYYQLHKTELMELFDSLADETSKRTLFHYVESYLRNCVYYGEQIPTRWKYFFGGKYERLYKHLDGEVWINCGAYDGDTIFSYFCRDFAPKKIYAFESDKETFAKLLKNLLILPPEKRTLIEPINEKIDATTDFEKILAGNKCTLLNADIEGAELSLLKSMEKIIRVDRPVMAICVYHYKEDLLTVPQFIQATCDDYVYYLRKYTPYILNLKKNHELVLYAVPKERAL